MKIADKLEGYKANLNTAGWDVSITGVAKTSTAPNGDVVNRRISAVPMLPIAIYSNVDSDTERVEIAFVYHNRWKSIIADRAEIASNTSIVKLADKGLPVDSSNAKFVVQYLNEVINNSMDKLPFAEARSCMGWMADDGFIPYTSEICYDGDDNCREIFKSLSEKGSLAEWCDYILPLREKLPMRLMLAASFASPLLDKVGENPFVLHCFGKTGIAKTVSLMVAMSVWGNPKPGGLVRTLNMTTNSLLSTAAFLNNIPFAGDELQTIKDRWKSYDQMIMCITEGIDRGRMTYDRINPTKTWKCTFITTGEDPCVLPNSGGGVKNRVIQVECNKPIVDNGNAICNFLKTNYGTAAKPYIEELEKHDLQAEYDEIFSDIINRGTDTTAKQAGAMSLMLLADRISTELFFPSQKPLAFEDVKGFMFTDAEVDIAERAYQFICDKISENAIMFDKDSPKGCWGKLDKTNNYCLINKTVLDKILRDNMFDFDSVKNPWLEKGYVEQQNKKFRWVAKINDVMTSCVKIYLPTEEEEDDDYEIPF